MKNNVYKNIDFVFCFYDFTHTHKIKVESSEFNLIWVNDSRISRVLLFYVYICYLIFSPFSQGFLLFLDLALLECVVEVTFDPPS